MGGERRRRLASGWQWRASPARSASKAAPRGSPRAHIPSQLVIFLALPPIDRGASNSASSTHAGLASRWQW